MGGQKYMPMKRTDGMNLANRKPYTSSRPPSGFQSSPGASNATILTDGVVGSPVTGGTSYWWGQCWTSGTDVDLQVDLGDSKMVSAFRAHLFGYEFWDALKGEVQDRVEILTSVDGVTFVSHGLLQTSLWRKDIPINYMLQDDERATGWNFERTIPSPVAARYVRYRVTPKRILCISELQVFDIVDYKPFDLRIALPGSAGPPSSNVPPSVSITSPAAASQFEAPATINVTAAAQDSDGTIQRVDFFVGSTPIGSATASPFTIAWTNVPAGTYLLTARATDNGGASTTSTARAVTVVAAPRNQPPQVAVTAPAAGTTFAVPANIAVAAHASDPDNGVARVEFFAGSVSIGVATDVPYRVTWSNAPAGSHTLTAVATDVSGAAASSIAVPITVSGSSIDEIVLHAAVQPQIAGAWVVTADATAASGARLQNPDAAAPKLITPFAAPTQAFDLTFNAEAGKAYRLWLRGKALGDSYNNDSVFVQFDGSVDASGTPIWRTNTTSATAVVLEDCSGCGVRGWGWADNGYGLSVLGPVVYFAQTGPQRIRIQAREDGLAIDQIVLSAAKYTVTAPGITRNDATILAATQPGDESPSANAPPQVSLTSPVEGRVGTAPATITLAVQTSDADGTVVAVDFYDGSISIARVVTNPFTTQWFSVPAGHHTLTARATDDRGAATTSAPMSITVDSPASGGVGINEIVLYAAVDAQVGGGWSVVADSTAAGSLRLQNPNANLAKVTTPLASPTSSFELSFNADAGKAYHLWMRGKALDDSYNNDSVYVQFDGSVDAFGVPMWRANTTSAASVILEACSGCGVQGWGWAGNAYGLNALGPVVYFATSGPQRIRIQAREDGLAIDQLVLSAVKYAAVSPGTTKNDTVILPR